MRLLEILTDDDSKKRARCYSKWKKLTVPQGSIIILIYANAMVDGASYAIILANDATIQEK